MGNFIPVEPEKWAEMVKAAASSDYWRIEAETDHARWLRTLEKNEKLRAEVERLTHLANQSEFYRSQLQKDTCRLENIQMQDAFKHYEAENARLKAEVERLRKAGDAMVQLLDHMDVVMDMNSDHPEVEAWNAARKGKQS